MEPVGNRAPSELTLDGVVGYWAAHSPEDAALDCRFGIAETMDWQTFEAAIGSTAWRLARAVKPGTPVALVCATGIDFHITVNALWRVGAAVLLLDRNWGPAIVDDLVRLVGCRTIYAPSNWRSHTNSGAELLPYPDTSLASDSLRARPSCNPDATALYATTSGTTNNPKCVAISHRRIRSAYACCLDVHDFSTVRSCACMFELNSLGILGICFLLPREVGAKTIIFPVFSISTVASTWKAVLESADFVYLVPPLVRLLNTLPATFASRAPMLGFCSAAPVAEDELRTLEARFPVRLFNCYGLTELTFAVFFGCRADDGGASSSIGFPIGIEARLVDSSGEVIVGPGRGELLITGPMLTDGYLNNPTATAETWQKRYLRTGDLAERDERGAYAIVGRIKDVVLRGGYTYYLGELEHYLRRAPEVTDVCAFRGRDLPSGDELCVMVQTRSEVSSEALLDWIRENMGANKLPNALYVSNASLPRNSNGKINRNMLSSMHLEGVLREGARHDRS